MEKRRVVTRLVKTRKDDQALVTEGLECGHEYAYTKRTTDLARPYPEERVCAICALSDRKPGRPRLEIPDLARVTVESTLGQRAYYLDGIGPVGFRALARLLGVSTATLRDRLGLRAGQGIKGA